VNKSGNWPSITKPDGDNSSGRLTAWVLLAVLLAHVMVLGLLGNLLPAQGSNAQQKPSAVLATILPSIPAELKPETALQEKPEKPAEEKPKTSNQLPEKQTEQPAIDQPGSASDPLPVNSEQRMPASEGVNSVGAANAEGVGAQGAKDPAIQPVPINTPVVNLTAHLPPSIQLRYAMNKGAIAGDAVVTWRLETADGQVPLITNNYTLSMKVSAGFFTVVEQTSRGQITERGLVPVRHTDKRFRRSEQAVHFDPVQKRVIFSNNRPEATWSDGLQDRLSMLVQLAAYWSGQAVTRSGGIQVGNSIELMVSSIDELQPWLWEVQANIEDKTVSGMLPWRAEWIKVQRRPRRDFDAQLEIWLAPELNYLPVRIRQTDSSGVTDQVLTQAL
jgi:Protein of unknown function (DUF3108)